MGKVEGNKRLNVGEVIEKLKEFPPDKPIFFFDEQRERLYWNITHIELDGDGEVKMSDQNFI